MGHRIADYGCGVYGRVPGVCGARAGRATGRQRTRFDLWSDWIRLHDFRGAARRTKARADMEDWTRPGVDARTPLARLLEFADDFVSWRISFWRNADERAHVVADHYGRERSVWRGAATLRTARDDLGREAGNDLRRNWECAESVARRSGSRRRGDLWAAGACEIRKRRWPTRGRIQRGADDGGH